MKKTMNKNIKDYLHLYLGCECIVKEPGESAFKSVLEGIQRGKFLLKEYGHLLLWEAAEIKPILRPLSDMTEEELIEQENIFKIYEPDFEVTPDMRKNAWEKIKNDGIMAVEFSEDNNPLMVFELFRYFLSKHFDLFGLIESGLAIDKTKLK